MKKWIENMIVAFSMYSKLPMPHIEWNKENMRFPLCFFPLIGCATGLLVYVWSLVSGAAGFGTLFTTAVYVLIPVLVTGGIHLDGLLDTADALSSWQTREQRLEIMKDSRAGAFAVIAGCAYFLAAFGIWSMADQTAVCVLAVGFVLSRALSGLGVTTIPCAKGSGLVHAFAEASDRTVCRRVLLVETAAAMAGMIWICPFPGAAGAAASAGCFFAVRRMAMRKFGGTTGDIQGFFLQVCELVMAVVVILTEFFSG